MKFQFPDWVIPLLVAFIALIVIINFIYNTQLHLHPVRSFMIQESDSTTHSVTAVSKTSVGITLRDMEELCVRARQSGWGDYACVMSVNVHGGETLIDRLRFTRTESYAITTPLDEPES